MLQFLHAVGIFLLGLIVGAGLTYGFRGWIQRTKSKVEAPFRADVQTAHNFLTGSLAKEGDALKADVQRAIAALVKWLPFTK